MSTKMEGNSSPKGNAANGEVEIFVPGRICLFGEHSDWAGGYRRFNSDIAEGCALVCGTTQGLYARAKRIKSARQMIFRTHQGEVCEFALDDAAKLREISKSCSFFAYIAGTLIEIGKHFRVGGAEITNYKSDLPIKKGLSSSAAICVLVVRALNELYDLKLTVHGEMDIAYRGEINTPSRCGRLDQCVAFGQRVTRMSFDMDIIDTERVHVAATLYLVVVDLCAAKDTKEILKQLNTAYPFPKEAKEIALHSLLGEANLRTCREAIEIMTKERDPEQAAMRMGELMSAAQRRWDETAVQFCPEQLTAPTLHRLLEAQELKPYITGGKGVGSQGDGSAQLVCRSKEAQERVMELVASLGMDPLSLTISAQKSVRTAVIPIAGSCVDMWPATKCIGPWMFPIRMGDMVKPAICWLCEELMDAEIEQIILVVNETTQKQMEDLFQRREDFAVLDKVAAHAGAYDEDLLAIGKRLKFVRQDHPSGITEALLRCETHLDGEPFLLAWGDTLCCSSVSDGPGPIAQLMAAFDGSKSIAALHSIDRDLVHTTGVFACPHPSKTYASQQCKKSDGPTLWPISVVSEKPTTVYAEEHLKTPGLDPGKFLASFGQYVLTPSFFQVLHSAPRSHFSAALDQLRTRDGLNGILIEGGMRWDLGNPRTYLQVLQAQVVQNTRKRRRTDSN